MMSSDSESSGTEKRESKRIKAASLNKEIADIVVNKLETVEIFFENCESKEDSAINQFCTELDECLLSVNEKYNELESITENKVDETTENMYTVFRTDLMQKKEKLKMLLEERTRLTHELLQEEELILQQSAQAYNEQLEKFNKLMEKMKVIQETPSRAKLPAIAVDNSQPRSTHQPTVSATHQTHEMSTQPSHSENPNPTDNLNPVKQLAESLIVSMKATRRSTPAPAVYDGDPISFQDWEIDFDAYVESEGLTGKEPLRYLKNYVSGKAKDAISGHFITNTEKAYLDARKELKERFGSKHSVDRALRDKLEAWPKIGTRDSTELRSYADFLLHVKSAMANVPELESLSNSKENEKLAAKLPDWLIRNWARKVKEKRKSEQKYPEFSEFVDFVVDHTEVADEPLMRLCTTSNKEHSKRKPKSNPGSGNLRTFGTNSTKEMCAHCKKPHPTAECYAIARMSEEKREAFVKEHKLCWGCFHTGHRSKDCENKAICKKCSRRHPTVLHKEPGEFKPRNQNGNQNKPAEKNEAAKEDSEATNSTGSVKQSVKATGTHEGILSMVVPIHVSTLDNPTRKVLVYALLDTQSDSSYITTKTAKAINAQYTTEVVTMDTLHGESTTTINKYKNVRVQGYNEVDYTTVEAYGWDRLTGNVKNIPNRVNVGRYPHLKEHANKFPPPLDIPIGMLIGADCPQAFAPLEAVLGKSGEPFAQKTMLGWTVLGGKSWTYQHREHTRANATTMTLNDTDEDLMVSQEDIKFLDIMEKGIHKNKQGYLEAPLPFRLKPVMPNNRVQAEKRLIGLKKKMDKDDTFKHDYNSFMEDLLKRGHAEEINNPPTDGQVWYIPHFAVSHQKKNKLRVVFDCSATFGSTSLNEHLLQGPDLINNMLGILLRFRKEPIAIACDVEKMFHNFFVNEEDRDFLRFLWFEKDGSIKEYRMMVHLFGATSSPAVATYSLRKLAESHKEEAGAASEFIKRNFYVDDGIASVPTKTEALQLIRDARRLCQKGNLRLHKFVSNEKEVLRELPDTEKAINDVDLYSDNLPTQRTLGLEWSIDNDTLRFTNSGLRQRPSTRRGILSMISQLFDPLGFLAPYTLIGKNILQQINKAGGEWDEPIEGDIQEDWTKWTNELEMLDNIQISRCIKPINFGTIKRCELHHFCDASLNGMGACSYIRLISKKNKIHTSLLLAKSRVVPSKGITTIPRLELQSAVMATQLSATLRKELDMEVHSEIFWTDSEIVLAYLANEQKKFHVYVANRIREIKMSSDAQQWHHINSAENAADIVSRGMSCSKLKTSTWFTGPEFLKQDNLERKLHGIPVVKIDDKDPEVKRVKDVKATKLQQESIYHNFTKFSSLAKLITSIAYLRQMAAKKSWKNLHSPDVDDLKNAQEVVVKITQNHHFKKELLALKNGGTHLPRDSSLLRLNPYLDAEGLLRVGGRTRMSTALSADEKHPVIIPKNCHLGKLLIRATHEKGHHLGTAYTLNATRQNGFWVIGGARTTKEIINSCILCKRLRGPTETQLMADLPMERVENTPPFTNVGVDCFGPFMIKERRTELKRWGVLFTCLFSRAVHVEVVDDLSTDAFINTLRCFVAIRGPVNTLFCDNGTNFVGAKNELAKQLAIMSDEKIKNYLKQNQIKFKMTSPTASHQGGAWERQIRSIRSVLNEISLKYAGRMDTTMLRTALYEAMATVNSRPITATCSDDPEDAMVTPNHLLTQKTSQVAPLPGDFSDEDAYSRARWRRVQSFANDFWDIWKTKYLSNITQRQKWITTKENLTEGDIVIVADESKPRNQWQIAVVETADLSSDGLVRNVYVRLGNRNLDRKGVPLTTAVILKRPIQKLVLLQRKPKALQSTAIAQTQSIAH